MSDKLFFLVSMPPKMIISYKLNIKNIYNYTENKGNSVKPTRKLLAIHNHRSKYVHKRLLNLKNFTFNQVVHM